jgi:hypothetical protein
MKIAQELTIKDWEDLEEKLVPNNDELWGLAFHFFEERIRTRYLNPINAILDLKLNNGEGFAVVNLQCSLIETIESFINGWVYNNDNTNGSAKGWYDKVIDPNSRNLLVNNNEYIFVSFFNNHIDFIDMITKGLEFYKDVRCACLHETQTKNKWLVKSDNQQTKIFFKNENGEKIIFRENFQKALENSISDYKKAIIEGTSFNNITSGTELRENFKAKMKHICDKS